ncbi:MAG: molybdopterin converting factor subunit 1 [Myxococcales bacterium]|nr:molybdopterin converting factor subunit 1 [Myxococcales bacterium]
MTLTVLLFAGLRDRLRRESISIELPRGATVRALLEHVAAAHPELASSLAHCRVAVDHAFATDDETIDAPAEVALIPPVSGGSDGAPDDDAASDAARFVLTDAPLDPARVIDAVAHRHAGGITSFIGNVRRRSMGKSIDHLEYEAYPEMVLTVMREIAAAIERETPGARVAIHHRVGRLGIGETAVVIAASAPHRAEAFAACRAAIEALKRDVPIWKREVSDDGETWYGRGP